MIEGVTLPQANLSSRLKETEKSRATGLRGVRTIALHFVMAGLDPAIHA